jgi:AraC-like DNA-binding protein
MQHECSISHIGHRAEDDHELRRRYFSLPQQDSWRPPQTRSAGLMVFDHKGRLVKADSDAQLIMAALGVELSCTPRLRIDALDASDPQPLRDAQLPRWLDPAWIEPIIEGDERLGTVVQIPKPARSSAPRSGQNGLPAYKLRQAIEFVEAHLDQPINLERLSAAVRISPFHFHRQFKRSTGLTPSKYIRRVRIERAKALLSDSGLPIVDVAVQVGFADQSHFTAAFREATSMTPRTYRNATATA